MTLGQTITIIVTTGGKSERVKAQVTRMSGRDCVHVTPLEGEYDGRELRLGRGCRIYKGEPK